VTQRGSRRQRTFFDEDDYRRYLDLLRSASERFGVLVEVYSLMPNHVHLIAVPEEATSLSRALRQAHQTYAKEINERMGWCGHFWQQRFHSSAMDEHHARNAVGYVLLNPVRASLVARPEDWPWSNAAELLSRDSSTPARSGWRSPVRSELAELLTEGAGERFAEKLRRDSRRGLPLGDDLFLDRLEAEFGRPMRPGILGRRPRLPDHRETGADGSGSPDPIRRRPG
jgi:putative transposase